MTSVLFGRTSQFMVSTVIVYDIPTCNLNYIPSGTGTQTYVSGSGDHVELRHCDVFQTLYRIESLKTVVLDLCSVLCAHIIHNTAIDRR